MSVSSLAKSIRDGQVTAQETISAIAERIEETKDMNIYITVNPQMLEQAKDIDRKIRSGNDAGRLAGVPISIKDNICVTGMPTTCASRMLESYVSPYDATVITRLRDEGAIIVGKTNMDEFAMGLTTEFSSFGPTLNPCNKSYVPGGSSGGSAASVAAGTAAVSLGSDTGGSVRNPASFCGVAGFKPTYGMISRYGLISYANSIEQIGPMARSVSDIETVMSIICGRDPYDHTTMTVPANTGIGQDPAYTIKNKRVGIIKQMVPPSMPSGIRHVLDEAISRLTQLGASIDEVSLDMVDYSVAAYYTITSAEAASNLARYDNIRYGYDMDISSYEFHRYVTKSRSRFGPEVKRRIIAGGFVTSAGYSGKYFLKALKVKDRLTRNLDSLFREYDYLLSPTVPVLPFRLGERIDDPVSLFDIDVNTVMANLAGKPAISVPYGESGGLSVGIQIMADSGHDGDLLRTAHALEDIQ